MNYSSFSHVIDTYKVVMLDSYGVVKNHKGLIEGVQESIRTLKQKENISATHQRCISKPGTTIREPATTWFK